MADPPADGTPVDQRDPQRRSPNQPVSPAALRDLGVLVWKVPPGTPSGEARLAAIKEVRGYNYSVRKWMRERGGRRGCGVRGSLSTPFLCPSPDLLSFHFSLSLPLFPILHSLGPHQRVALYPAGL